MMGDWTFFSNHGHVLVCLARNSKARLRDVASDVGITERAVQKIVKDLQEGGYITVRKQGRCNRYRINRRKTLRHGLESHCTIGKLLALVAPAGRIDRPDETESTADVPPAQIDEPVGEASESAAAEAETATEPTPAPPAPEPLPGTAREPAAEPASQSEPGARQGPPDADQQGSLF